MIEDYEAQENQAEQKSYNNEESPMHVQLWEESEIILERIELLKSEMVVLRGIVQNEGNVSKEELHDWSDRVYITIDNIDATKRLVGDWRTETYRFLM